MKTLRIWQLLLAVAVPALAAPLAAQTLTATSQPTTANAPEPSTANIIGTVTDVNNGTIPGATVALVGPVPDDRHTVVANDQGYFEFHDLKPGVPYRATVRADGFTSWTSPAIILNPGQYEILTGAKLRIEEARTTITVQYSTEEIATEQIKVEEQQRVFGIFPNFYTVYDPNPVPLTTKLKFRLALKTASDPVTAIGVVALAGMNQAGDTPNYPQGWKGFGQRVGAASADGFSNIMIGGAILPSLLHQDPRYYYQGTGTKKSRSLHALSSPFICKGDNGKWQPNYSSLGGDLASATLSNAYYPSSNRGVGLTFENVLISTGGRMASALVKEFILRRFTPSAREQK